MKMVTIGGMILPLLLGAAIQAQASVAIPTSVIDFEALAHDDADIVSHGSTYTEDGYLLTNLATEEASGWAPSFSTYGLQESNFSGSTALMNDNYPGTTRLTTQSGALFTVYSIQLTELSVESDYEGEDSITFNGLKNDGSVVSYVYDVNGVFDIETLCFTPGLFSDLLALEWETTAYNIQFDNINVSPVPVPSSILLFGTVLTALAAAGKGRKRS